MKKKNFRFASLALAGILLFTGCGQDGAKGDYMTVNGKPVSQATYDKQLDLYKTLMAAQYRLPESIKFSLIREQVLLQDLEKNSIEITKDDYAVEYNQAVSHYGGADKYGAALKSIGITDEQMKDSLRIETINRKHREWYNSQHTPSDDDLKKYYEDNKDKYRKADASHILVKTEEEAKSVKERLDAGEKFEDLAKELSTDSSKDNGGSLGVAPVSNYDPDFSKALLALEEGQVSDPVKTQFGYHIIRLNKKHDSFEDNKEDIISALLDEQYEAYVNELVKAADVKVKGEESSESSVESSNSKDPASESSIQTEESSSQESKSE